MSDISNSFQPIDDADNPYQSPEYASYDGGGFDPYDEDLEDAVAIRNEHLNHEGSIRSVGALYLLGATLSIILSVSFLVMAATDTYNRPGKPEEAIGPYAMFAIVGLLGMLQGYVGIKLRQLAPAGRVGGKIFSAVGLIGFPIGTIINGYILYLLMGKKGSMIFSPQYQKIMRATPEIQYRTSAIVRILAGVLLVLVGIIIVIGLIAAVSSARS